MKGEEAMLNLVSDIKRIVGSGNWPDVASGATVTVKGDGARLYEAWKKFRKGALASFRVSTHHVRKSLRHPQYEISDFTVAGEPSVLLVGLTSDGDTFFQFEAHSGTPAHPREALSHLGDLKRSREEHVNVGPGGKTTARRNITVKW
jgi:hypothetical protein